MPPTQGIRQVCKREELVAAYSTIPALSLDA
jgi:hypothetical protein